MGRHYSRADRLKEALNNSILDNSILEFSEYGHSFASLRSRHWDILPGKKQKM